MTLQATPPERDVIIAALELYIGDLYASCSRCNKNERQQYACLRNDLKVAAGILRAIRPTEETKPQQ